VEKVYESPESKISNPNEQYHAYFMQNDFHLGKEILKQLKDQERPVAWLAKRLRCDRSNLNRQLHSSEHLHGLLIKRISKEMSIDFFAYCSQSLLDNDET